LDLNQQNNNNKILFYKEVAKQIQKLKFIIIF